MAENVITDKYSKKRTWRGFSIELKELGVSIRKTFKKRNLGAELQATKEMVFEIALMGLLLNVGMTFFGFTLGVFNVLAFGCAFWVFDKKLKHSLMEIISSFQLVRVYK